MSVPQEVVGFIGTGHMGKPMALNLIRAGYSLMAFDLNPKPLEELKSNGATVGRSVIEVSSQSDVMITMLPKSKEVEEVMLGEQGVIAGARRGSIVIDMSTIDASVSRKIAKVLSTKNVKMLDAPVSGGYLRAEAGTLSIMVGGEEKVYQQCLDIFKVLGKNIFYCGPNGNGAVVKIVNNLLGAIQAVASAEALSMGVKAGVDFKVLTDVIGASSGTNDFIRFAGPAKAFKGDYEPGFTVDLMHKDLGLAITLASEQGMPLLMGTLTHQMYLYLKSLGLEKKDFSIITKLFEDSMKVSLKF
jgi:3-hydroxyisobutyrate dehydrogenase